MRGKKGFQSLNGLPAIEFKSIGSIVVPYPKTQLDDHVREPVYDQFYNRVVVGFPTFHEPAAKYTVIPFQYFTIKLHKVDRRVRHIPHHHRYKITGKIVQSEPYGIPETIISGIVDISQTRYLGSQVP